MKYLDRIPMSSAVIFALMLGLAPFHPEPHLVEKLRMLFEGTLSKPIDVFDLLMHAAMPIVVLVKIFRRVTGRDTTVHESSGSGGETNGR